MVLPSLGVPIGITSDDGDIVLNGESTVVSRDLIASNGVIHGLDTVLQSQQLIENHGCEDDLDHSSKDWHKLLFST